MSFVLVKGCTSHLVRFEGSRGECGGDFGAANDRKENSGGHQGAVNEVRGSWRWLGGRKDIEIWGGGSFGSHYS